MFVLPISSVYGLGSFAVLLTYMFGLLFAGGTLLVVVYDCVGDLLRYDWLFSFFFIVGYYFGCSLVVCDSGVGCFGACVLDCLFDCAWFSSIVCWWVPGLEVSV